MDEFDQLAEAARGAPEIIKQARKEDRKGLWAICIIGFLNIVGQVLIAKSINDHFVAGFFMLIFIPISVFIAKTIVRV